MALFKHLLVPTDFGEAADAALDLAIDLAGKFGAKITIFHAYHIQMPAYGDRIYWPMDDLARMARQALDARIAKARERHPMTEGVLAYGDPSSQALEAARDSGADLIVMGTRGRQGIARVLLGSVAAKVVRASPIPVLTVSAAEERALPAASAESGRQQQPSP
jgi:nucleotide-binding universal stress UspA family protein